MAAAPPRNDGIMHARFASPRNPVRCHCCLCLHCLAPLKFMKVSRILLNHSLSVVEYHRPQFKSTGHGNRLIDQILNHRLDTDGRSAPKVVGRPFLPAEPCFDSSRGQTVHGMEFSKQCVHGHSPYHAMGSREFGTRPSDHQLRISMRDGPRSQVCISM